MKRAGTLLSQASVWCWIVLCWAGAVTGATGVVYQQPYAPSFHPLDVLDPSSYNPLRMAAPAVLELNSSLFHPVEEIDFEKRQITFAREDNLGFRVWEYHYPEISDYLGRRLHFSFFDGWTRTMASKRTVGEQKKGLPSLEFALPVQWPTWAERILGKEPPKLTFDGYLRMSVGWGVTNNLDKDDKSVEPEISQDYRFSVRGTVGRVIDINLSTDSQNESIVDQLKFVKIAYRDEGDGLEDEIIQEVVAGYQPFSMPGTQLSGYSEQKDGLFGVKVRSQLGPLSLTTIFSQERAESQQKVLNPGSTQAAVSSSGVGESDIDRYRYFWLDTLYLNAYRARIAGSGGQSATLPKITQLQIWVQQERSSEKDKFVDADITDKQGETYNYRLLYNTVDYDFSDSLGWVRFNTRVPDAMRIGIYMRSSDGRVDKGDTMYVIDPKNPSAIPNELKGMWLLKTDNPGPTDSTFSLAWRNTYQLVKGDGKGFALEIKQDLPTTSGDSTMGPGGLKYVQILGLYSKENSIFDTKRVPYIDDVPIFDFEHGVMTIPSFANALIGHQPFRNPALDGDSSDNVDATNATIYSQSFSRFNDDNFPRDKYQFLSSGIISQGEGSGGASNYLYSLGYNLIPGSERAVAGKTMVLERHVDYTIDYDNGEIELISGRAKAASEIIVTFQQESVFVPENKLFVGVRGEVKLPFISDNSLIGASFLYQKADAAELIPRLKQEPYSKMLLDLNTRLDFEPKWMTTLVDALPGIATQAPSSVNFEFEVAHSRMNPNLRGKAYLDDFEASKLVLPLGENYATWFRGSPPVDILQDLVHNPPAWHDFWYTAQDASTDRSRIWVQDEQDVAQRASERFEPVLRLISQPAPDLKSPLANRYDNPWTAIMNPLPGSMADLTRYKYLELTVRKPKSGKLFVDMGVISEDVSADGGMPNGVLNDEDTSGLGIYKPELDRGLDFRADGEEFWLVPDTARNGWDTLGYGNALLPFPTDPSRDNWANYSNADTKSRGVLEKVNGTQDNGDPPNSEDVNFDDALQTSLQERFFRFTIDFNDTVEMARYRNLTTTAQAANGWFHFIIPLSDSALVVKSAQGRQPEWQDIRAVRLVWTDFVDKNSRDSLDIARIQFVGNQWHELPTTVSGTDTVYKMDAQVINSTENPEYRAMRTGPDGYVLPFTSRQTEDGKAYRPEQALRMVFDSLNPGEVALAERRLERNAIDVSMYEKMMLYVRSDKNYSSNDSALSFVLRFGTNSSCYYEYRTDRLHVPAPGQAATAYARAGWDERNFVNIDLKELSDFKYEVLLEGEKDSIALSYSSNPRYRIYSSTKALPSISRIEWMALGVVRDSGAVASMPLSGEIWANELMAEGIRQLNGTAARASLTTKWADFLTLNTGMSYDDGDFRTMTNNAIGAGNSTLSGNAGVDFTLDRFLPASWGVKVPLGAHVSGSLVRPQLVPDSDIPLRDNDESDGFSQMVGDAFDRLTNERHNVDNDTTDSERYQSVVRSVSLNSSFSKSSRSKNPLLNFTADRLALDVRYSGNLSERNEGPDRDGSGDGLFQRINRRDEYFGSVRYDLSPRNHPKWTSWRPLEGVKLPWLNRFKSYELSVLPQNLNFNVAQIRHFTRQDTIEKSAQGTREQGFTLDHGYNFSYQPLKPVLDITYNLDVRRDLKNAVTRKFKNHEGWGSFFSENVLELDSAWREYWLLNGEGGRTQKATLGFKPSFVNWLSHDFDYDVDYQSSGSPNLTDSLRAEISVNQNSTFRLNSSLDMPDLFREMATVSGKRAGVVFSAFQKGFEKVGLRSLQFNYTAALSVRNEHLTPDFLDRADVKPRNYFGYTLGLRGRNLWDIMTATVDDDASGGGRTRGLTPAAMQFRKDNNDSRRFSDDSRTGTQTYSLSTSLTLPQPLDIRFNTLKLGWDTKGVIRPDTAQWDSTRTWPDIRVNASSGFLSKVDLIDDFMQRVTLTSGYTYRRSESTSGLESKPPQLSIDNSWSPLIRLEGTTRKYPVNITYTFDRKNTQNHSTYWGQSITLGQNLSVNYSIPQATKRREFTVFRWTIPIQGKMDLRLTADYSKVLEYVERVAAENGEVMWEKPDRSVMSRSIRPQFTYIFTDKVKGEVFYEGSLRSSEESDDIRINRFAVIVDIQF